MIAGVAQGLANHLGLPVWLLRIAFIVTAFIGGMGVALYAAGWAFIRSEDEDRTPVDRFFSHADSPGNWLGAVLIVVAALLILGSFNVFSGQVLLAFALLSVGLLIYTGYLSMPASTDKDENDDKEGVQQVTTTTDDVVDRETATGDSPAAGTPVPPTPVTPTPPDLPPAKPRERSILGRLTVGAMLLGMGFLAVFDQIESVPIDAEPRHYLAMAVTVLGVGLLVGAVIGRARWLIIVGAILVPTLLFSPVFEYDWNSDTFDSFEVPTTFTAVESTYHQDIGNLRIDLTELDWNGESITIEASMDFGYLEVVVPQDVAVSGGAFADIGRVGGLGEESAGAGNPHVDFETTGEAGSVFLDLSIDIGNIQVWER